MLRVMTLGLAPKKEKEHFFKRDEGIVPCHPEETKIMPGSYQRLDLFIKVPKVLCPNLTDASYLFWVADSSVWKLFFYVGLTARQDYEEISGIIVNDKEILSRSLGHQETASKLINRWIQHVNERKTDPAIRLVVRFVHPLGRAFLFLNLADEQVGRGIKRHR